MSKNLLYDLLPNPRNYQIWSQSDKAKDLTSKVKAEVTRMHKKSKTFILYDKCVNSVANNTNSQSS